jgi:hypothetical protein
LDAALGQVIEAASADPVHARVAMTAANTHFFMHKLQ